MAVSLASAYATGGMTQIARSRKPYPAASMFIAIDVATAPTFRTRARIACRPCSASAIPSDAKTRAATSGMAASSAAIGATFLAANTIRYWASNETTAAAAARRPSAAIAARSHVAARSAAVPSPRGWRSDIFKTRVPFRAEASSNSRSSTPNGRHVSALIAGTSVHLGREIRGCRQGPVKELVEEFAQARVPQDGSQAQAPVNVPADPGSDAGSESCRQHGPRVRRRGGHDCGPRHANGRSIADLIASAAPSGSSPNPAS